MTTDLPFSTLKLEDVQGDIIGGLPKKTEVYYFFQITNAALFKSQLPKIVPLIKSTAQVFEDREKIAEHKRRHQGHGHHGKPPLLPMAGVNVSFSMFGLTKLGIPELDTLGDIPFGKGQLKDSFNLGDKGEGTDETNFVPNWNEPFKQQIDGVFDVAGDSHGTVEKKLKEILHILGAGTHHSSIHKVTSIWGSVRPDKEEGHEHFGFLDGISNPKINELKQDNDGIPGPRHVDVGNILLGRTGDGIPRPTWALDGSFLVFRHLYQLVPEFNEFLRQNPIVKPGLTPEEGSELLGARLVGRWKSGTPVELAPERDDLSIAKDPQKINNFRFQAEEGVARDLKCPFAAHVRKTNPRADLEDRPPRAGQPPNPDQLARRKIMRRGIQFGPEETVQEKHDHRTHHARGLLFACYQSNITDAFQFIQQSWANNNDFPPTNENGRTGEPDFPGFDIIIGQVPGNNVVRTRNIFGFNPDDLPKDLPVPNEFVIPGGGEYFFAPSIKTLREVFPVA